VKHVIVQTKAIKTTVHLLRSTTSQRCSHCGLRRILFALALYPAGYSPEVWMCAEDMGIRPKGGSGAPSPTTDDPVMWDETHFTGAVGALVPKP